MSRNASAANWNPQNVPGPQVVPSIGMSALDTVQAQLDALHENNKPWSNHGLLTMYEFGETVGGLDRCYYFGYGKDLYHFDHFMGQFQNELPELVNLHSYSIEGSKYEEDVHKVLVDVVSGLDLSHAQFVFVLAEKDIGTRKGALMTRCLIRHKPQ